jgi:hypothetical protein
VRSRKGKEGGQKEIASLRLAIDGKEKVWVLQKEVLVAGELVYWRRRAYTAEQGGNGRGKRKRKGGGGGAKIRKYET